MQQRKGNPVIHPIEALRAEIVAALRKHARHVAEAHPEDQSTDGHARKEVPAALNAVADSLEAAPASAAQAPPDAAP